MSGRIDFGGAEELLDRLKYQPLFGWRVRTLPDPPAPSTASPGPPELIAAAAEARALLDGGRWIRSKELHRIARKHGVGFDILLHALPEAGESDTGRWYCIPDRLTPSISPDGT